MSIETTQKPEEKEALKMEGRNLLKGKKGIISGALDSNSIAWKVAEIAVAQGAEIVLTNAPIAMRMGEINKLAEKCNAQIVPADATSVADLENLFTKSQEILGGKVDFVFDRLATHNRISFVTESRT